MKTSFFSSLFLLMALMMENNVGIILALCVFIQNIITLNKKK